MNRKYKFVLAKLICGILPLEIEMGRWKIVEAGIRLCQLSHTDVEDEYHFIFRCNQYLLKRKICVDTLNINNFDLLSVSAKWKAVMCEDNISLAAKYLWEIYIK